MKRLFPLLLLALAPAPAHAISLGLDLYGAWQENGYDDSGPGLNVRLGQDLGVGVKLQLEAGGTYVGFKSDTLWAGFGGLRLGFGELIQPGIYAHLGYANLDQPASKIGTGRAVNASGLFGRAGAFLDLALPIVSVGADVAYDAFLTGDFQQSNEPSWVTAGVHAGLSF
jgi:hypothetical protein